MTDEFIKSLDTLNPAQKEAVFHDGGPLLIVAGAGTGKTKVITSRILNLIQSEKALASEILALTFTEKAAQEMMERVDMYMPLSHEEIWIKTFHGFAEKILREKATVLGLRADYKVYAKLDQWIFFKKHLFEFELEHFRPLSMPTQHISNMLEHFSRVKEEFIKPDQYIEYAEKNLETVKAKSVMSEHAEEYTNADESAHTDEGEKTSKKKSKNSDPKTVLEFEIAEAEKIVEIARAYKKYEELMREENALDFGDLSYFVLRLFDEFPEVLAEYQEKFKYIMVDEFQDTNYAQFKLLMMLAKGNGTDATRGSHNLVVVGDDDQSIFRWRGASLSNIIQFGNEFPNAQKIVLTENYRSNQNILDASHFFVKFNDPNRLEARENISKSLHSQREEILPIESIKTDNYEQEVQFVLEKINELALSGIPLKEIAVLVRSNKNAIPFAEAFEKEDVPYQIRSPKGLLSLPEIKDIAAITKVIASEQEDVALYKLLNFDVFGMNPDEINELFKKTKDSAKKGEGKSAFNILTESANFDVLPGFEDQLTLFLQFINRVKEFSAHHTAGETIGYFLNESGYLRELEKRFNKESEKKIENITVFSKIVKEFEDKNKDNAEARSIKAFAEYLKMVEESGIPISDKEEVTSDMDAVQILTAHGAKGLEFDTVFVVNMVDSRFPVRKKSDPLKVPEELTKEILPEGDFRIEEERRLFYVALTRAKRKLYLTYSAKYEGNKEWSRSQFLDEVAESGLIEEKNGNDLASMSSAGSAGSANSAGAISSARKTDTNTVIKRIPTAWTNYKSFSYSQIDTFKTCPLKYGCRYVLNLAEPTSHSLTFGTTMHNTLDEFYKNLDLTNAATYSLETLQNTFKKNWSSSGFDNKDHEKDRFDQGLNILREFHKKNSQPWIKPAYMEKDFHLQFNGGQYSFSGRIDRIDQLPDGTFEVIDYKSGKSRALDKDYQLQLLVYALACRDYLKIPVSKLSIYFLEDNVKASLKKGVSDLDSVKDDLLYYIQKAKESTFPPIPGHMCNYCGFKLICPAV